MKKIITFIFLLLTSLTLIACSKSDFPTVNENHKVELTQAELEQELDGISINNNAMKVVLEIDGEVDDEKIYTKGELYFNEEGAIFELEANILMNGVNLEGSGTAYINDTGVYFNGGGEMRINSITTTIDNDKYLLASFDNIENPSTDFDIDLEEIFTELDLSLLLENPDFIKMIEGYDGLTFYKNNNMFQVKLVVNNELINAHPDIFSEDELSFNLEGDFELEAVITIVDKKLTEFGIRMTGEGVSVLATASVVDTMPAFPTDLDTYKPFEFGV